MMRVKGGLHHRNEKAFHDTISQVIGSLQKVPWNPRHLNSYLLSSPNPAPTNHLASRTPKKKVYKTTQKKTNLSKAHSPGDSIRDLFIP